MPFWTTAAIAGATLASGAIGAHAAGKAADVQSKAAMSAAELQKESADKALAFQQKEWDTQQKNQAPFLKAGTGAVNELSDLTKTPGSGLLTPWTQTFQAPTLEEAKQNPGYQFALDTGTAALDKSAAARGNLFSGTQGTALQAFGQNLGEQNYSDVYNRALGVYHDNYNIFNQNQANEYNRLANLAGFGQTSAGQLGQEGQAAADNSGRIVQNSAAQQGNDIQNAAAAQASGYVGGANAWTGALGNLSELPLYSQLLKNLNGSPKTATAPAGINNPAWLNEEAGLYS